MSGGLGVIFGWLLDGFEVDFAVAFEVPFCGLPIV